MPTRHPWNDQMAGFLHAIGMGELAAHHPRDDLPVRGAVIVLPTWTWGLSAINVGAKDRAKDGSRLSLPIQIGWDGGPLVVLEEGETVTLSWWMVGMGHSRRGEATVTCTDGTDGVDGSFEWSAPESETTIPVPVRVTEASVPSWRMRQVLDDLVEDGKLAMWEAMERYLAPALRAALRRSEQQLNAESCETHGAPMGSIFDPVTVDAIETRLLLGDEAKDGPVRRLLLRCATNTGLFFRVDPQRFMITAIARDAKAEMRRTLGDPHIGPKVRRIALKLGTRDIDAILREYRERYPADNLSARRAEAALGLWELPSAATFPLRVYEGADTTFEDEVVDSLFRESRRSQWERRTSHPGGGNVARNARSSTVVVQYDQVDDDPFQCGDHSDAEKSHHSCDVITVQERRRRLIDEERESESA